MTGDPSSARHSVSRFGEYELDESTLELRKAGRKLKLAPQPARVLSLLVSRSGELVTREELRQAVWGEQSFGDFERGLNNCLNILRVLLRDHPRHPRFIETLPRRGYRFVHPVLKPGDHTECSIAVLPFANLSADEENGYFSDGLADQIITELTRIRGLSVTARTSSFVFRDQQQDVRHIGRILRVKSLLEGSVQRYRGRLRVSAQLVNAADGFHLWSEHYDCEPGDLFEIQDEISRAIATALRFRLAPSRLIRSTGNPDACNWWLKGRYYQNCESIEALTRSRTSLERAIALDPRFAQAYVALAELYRAFAHYGLVRPREALTQAQAALRSAFELDDSLGEAFALSGAYRAWMQFDWPGANVDFNRALELAPGAEQVHRFRATHLLVPTKRLSEAEQEMEIAVRSNPLSPLACIELGKVLLWKREYDRAQEKMEEAFALRPEYALAIWYRGAALYFQGRVDDALGYWQSALDKMGANPPMIGAIGMCLGLIGRRTEARAVLAELDAAESERYVSPVSRAQVYMGLGDLDATFAWLARAIEERDLHILILPCKPIWDLLRPDPRFKALMHKMLLV